MVAPIRTSFLVAQYEDMVTIPKRFNHHLDGHIKSIVVPSPELSQYNLHKNGQVSSKGFERTNKRCNERGQMMRGHICTVRAETNEGRGRKGRREQEQMGGRAVEGESQIRNLGSIVFTRLPQLTREYLMGWDGDGQSCQSWKSVSCCDCCVHASPNALSMH